ncbi:MAG TPA: ShlB/FhaC/HecB family hemolysin secretion/activation protein, partial [Geobacteraceae bacterium]|nr:ShlB/FhaC/HecB family hemolysin secretion/activation protein [Geobacteraceae bacterium]
GAYVGLFGHDLYTLVSGGFSFGSLNINDEAQRALNMAGADTAGFYSKFNLTLSANLELTGKLSAKASFKLQQVLSGNNLDSSEQFFISGTSGVRAYTESVGFDNGTLVNVELRYELPTLFDIRNSVGLFFDNGWAYAENGNYTANNSFVLNDAGVGYYIAFKQLFCNVQLAQPIGKTGGVNDPGTRFLIQFGAAFL